MPHVDEMISCSQNVHKQYDHLILENETVRNAGSPRVPHPSLSWHPPRLRNGDELEKTCEEGEWTDIRLIISWFN